MSTLLWKLLGSHVPRTELVRFKDVDFFPPTPQLETMSRICIGSKTRTIGDALMLSTLPGLLKAKYPALKIDTYPRAFNPVVFANNPAIDGIDYFPGKLFGDDCNLGSGHLIQLKEQYFGLPQTEPPRAQLFLTEAEIRWAKKLWGASQKPVVIIHPWGKTHSSVLNAEAWSKILDSGQDRFRFMQVGIEGQEKVAGCEKYFFLSKAFPQARKLFSLISQAQFFMGVDSGPMHVARAFLLPSWIASDYGKKPELIFQDRKNLPYFQSPGTHAFLYEQNTHIDVSLESLTAVLASGAQFLKER